MANVNDVRGKSVKIKLLDGVERTLKFDLNAMADLEDKYGTIENAFNALEAGSLKAVRFFLWTGLVHEDESLTERQVGSLIDMEYMQTLTDTLGNAFNNDMPVEQTEEQPVVQATVANPNV